MKPKIVYLLVCSALFLQSCKEETNTVTLNHLISNAWSPTSLDVRGIGIMYFKPDGSHLITIPSIVSTDPIVTSQDSIFGTYSLNGNILVLASQVKILTPKEENGTVVYEESISKFDCTWEILSIDEQHLEIDDITGNAVFGCLTNKKRVTFEAL